jgi:hypothetical protein
VFDGTFSIHCGPGYLSRYSDSLRAGRSEDRILVGPRFSAPVQTGPGSQLASYVMGTGSFPGVKRPGRGVDNPPPSSDEVKERVEPYFYSPSGPLWPVIGWTLPLPLPLQPSLLQQCIWLTNLTNARVYSSVTMNFWDWCALLVVVYRVYRKVQVALKHCLRIRD